MQAKKREEEKFSSILMEQERETNVIQEREGGNT